MITKWMVVETGSDPTTTPNPTVYDNFTKAAAAFIDLAEQRLVPSGTIMPLSVETIRQIDVVIATGEGTVTTDTGSISLVVMRHVPFGELPPSDDTVNKSKDIEPLPDDPTDADYAAALSSQEETVAVTFRVDADLRAQFHVFARKNNQTVASILRNYIIECISKNPIIKSKTSSSANSDNTDGDDAIIG